MCDENPRELTFMERLVKEEEELNIKVEKLDVFIRGENFKKLDRTKRYLLTIQFDAMVSYAHVLKIRILDLK